MKFTLGGLGITTTVLYFGMYLPSVLAEEVQAEQVEAVRVSIEVNQEDNGVNVRIAKSGGDGGVKKSGQEEIDAIRRWRFELSKPDKPKTWAIFNLELEGFEIEEK